MSQSNANEIMKATIKVEADTEQARDDIKATAEQVWADMTKAGDAADASGQKAEKAATSAAGGFEVAAARATAWLAAIAAIDKGLEMLAEGVKAYQTASDVAAGRGDPFSPARIGSARERLGELEKDIKKVREEAEKAAGKSDNVLPDPYRMLTGGESEYQQKMRKLSELEKEAGQTRTAIQNAEKLEQEKAEKEAADKRAASLADRIERERIATLEGVQRIEAEKQAAMKKAREQYGDSEDTGALLRQIQVRYDREVSAFQESEAKKAKAEADRIAERERREKEARERDSKHAADIAQRIADANARAMQQALGSVAADFNRQLTAQINQMAFTMEGLAANVRAIALQRRAVG